MKISLNHLVKLLIYLFLSNLVSRVANAQKTFSSPEKAAEALLIAAEDEDLTEFVTLFGSDFMDNVRTGDEKADRLGIKRIAMLMHQEYKLAPRGGREFMLEMGSDAWPFPLRVILINNAGWAFDVERGKAVLIKRRIEKNEKRATQIADFYARAQQQYFAMIKKATGVGYYAKKFLSSPGRSDGLYWETGTDGVASPLAPLVNRAMNLGYEKKGDEHPLLMGYYYRVLTAQGEYAPGKTRSYLDSNGNLSGGFALLSFPSKYGVSGKMSYIVGEAGTVYEKDLGERTSILGSRMDRYDPDPSWHVIAGKIPIVPVTTQVISTADSTFPFYTE